MKKKYVARNPQDVEKKLCEMFGIDAGNVATLDISCRPGERPVATATLFAVESRNTFDIAAACKKALENCETHTRYGALLRIAETKAAFKLATVDMKSRHKKQVHQAWLNKIANHE